MTETPCAFVVPVSEFQIESGTNAGRNRALRCSSPPSTSSGGSVSGRRSPARQGVGDASGSEGAPSATTRQGSWRAGHRVPRDPGPGQIQSKARSGSKMSTAAARVVCLSVPGAPPCSCSRLKGRIGQIPLPGRSRVAHGRSLYAIDNTTETCCVAARSTRSSANRRHEPHPRPAPSRSADLLRD